MWPAFCRTTGRTCLYTALNSYKENGRIEYGTCVLRDFVFIRYMFAGFGRGPTKYSSIIGLDEFPLKMNALAFRTGCGPLPSRYLRTANFFGGSISTRWM